MNVKNSKPVYNQCPFCRKFHERDLEIALDALRFIASGGYYGMQAREYKQVALDALAKVCRV